MATLRIVFMGTPDFAVPSLQALLSIVQIEGRTTQVVGVFTQPDRPAGRGNQLGLSPVKRAASELGLPVFQPVRLRDVEGMTALRSLAPDVIVVAAYAQMLPQAVLDLPQYRCLNVHASLLPRYRGASPIQAAILNGDAETGVSIMLVEPRLDTGSVLSRYREALLPTDTTESLSLRLAIGGAKLLAETIPAWIAGHIVPEPQYEPLATMTRKLAKEHGRVDWSMPGVYIERQVRAMFSWPGAFTLLNGGLLKLHTVSLVPGDAASAVPGMVLMTPGSLDPVVATGEGLLVLREVQPAGRRSMSGAEWLRGVGNLNGIVLR